MKKRFSTLSLSTAIAACLLTICLLMLLAYLIAPSSNHFDWTSINPLNPLAALLFLLCFGAGVPLWAGAIILLLLLFILFKVIHRFIKRYKEKKN